MNKLVSAAMVSGKPPRRLAVAATLTVAASLLVAGATVASADPEPAPTATSAPPSMTTFPKPEDPDAPLRAAVAQARKTGQPVPVEAAFTESARVWAYPDGHLTTQAYDGPVQLKQADGGWSRIDTSLVERDGVLRPKLAKADVSFSLGGDGPFASLARDGKQRVALSWGAPLPRPEITGDKARYADAAGPGADLVATALPTGFRHDVVLRERPTKPVEFRLPVETDGLTLSMSKGGGLALKNSKGKTALSAPAPRMWDAAAADTADGRPGREAKVRTSVETKDGRTVLVLKPDPAWLADPATRYPVTVDPTTTLGVTQEVGIMSPNSQISPGRVGRQNYRYCTGTWPNQTCADRPETLRALMAFDTTSIANRNVLKATMQLTLRANASSCLVNYQSIFAHRITEAWVADDTFWSRQPATTPDGRASINPCIQPQTAGAVWSWDLTAMAQAWAGGTPNHGLMLQLGTETTPASNASENFDFWAQMFNQNVPKLSVDWVLPPEIPTVAAESIDSLSGNDAIARSTAVKVTYKSGVPEATPLDYTVSVNDSTMAPPPAQLPTGEAAYWKLDETSGAGAADASGHNLNATLTGAYSRVPGQVGQALKLSGGTGATAGPVLNTDQSYTVTAWVRLEDSAEDQVVFSQQGVNQPAFTLAYARSTVPEVDQRWVLTMVTQDIPDRIYEQWAVSKNIARVGRWSHVAVQYDQTAHKIRLFVDGELADERDHTANWNARGAFQFGKGQIAGSHTPFTGAIDDVHAYQRVLSPADLRTMVTAPGTTTNNGVPAGQTPERIFSLDNPASFKFVVKACRTGVTPPSCNESPAYRITSDAATLPTDTETGMADPVQPILSGMVNRPSGGPVTAKYYLYDNAGTPVGSAPLGTRNVNGGERASFQIPANTVQPGTTYKWQMVACAVGQGGTTTPGDTPAPTPTPTPTPTPLPQGLVAAYGMNEGAGTSVGDVSGKNNTGTAQNTTWTTGKYGKALSFNGTSSKVSVPHNAGLVLPQGMTMSAWVNPTSVSGWRSVAFKDYTGGVGYGLYASNGTAPSSWLRSGGVHQQVDGTAALSIGTWSHLAVTHDGTTARLYVNGQQVAQKAVGALEDSGGALQIGANTNWGEYFGGAIDELRIYNRAQSAAEIQADMQAPVGAAPTPSPTPTPTTTPTDPTTPTTPMLEEVCTPKTAPVSFTTPGTPPPPPVEDVRHLTLGKDNFVIKSAKTDPTACGGAPCTVTDDTVIRVGGTGIDKTAAAIGFKLDELPDGAGVSEGLLKLGAPTCAGGTCPADAVITATPLKSPVTGSSRGSDLPGDADTTGTPDSLPLSAPEADIAGSEYQWLLLTSDRDEVITFGETTASEQPSLALTYLPAGPPSKVLNLATQAGDGGAVASWGLPETNGSVAMLDGYDVEVTDNGGAVVKTLDVKDPYAAITGLTNGSVYTVKVRAKTALGTGDWESASVTPKAVPPPPTGRDTCVLEQGSRAVGAQAAGDSGAQEYIARVKSYYDAQDAVLEGRAATIWDAPGVVPTASITAQLSLLNSLLLDQRAEAQALGESRASSAVTLGNAVVAAGDNGTVRVSVETKRTWQTQTAGASRSAATRSIGSGASGQVEPSEFTVSVFVFDRCGGLTIIEQPLECFEDSSDHMDPGACPGSIPGSLSRGLSTQSACSNDPNDPYSDPDADIKKLVGQCFFNKGAPHGCWNAEKPGFKVSETLIANEYTGTSKKRKGWGVTVDAHSYWFGNYGVEHGPTRDVWDFAHDNNFPASDRGTFVNYVRVWPMEKKANTAEAKYIRNNLVLKSMGEACFMNTKYDNEFGTAIEVDGELAPSGGVTTTHTSSREVTCKSYEATGPTKPSSPNPKDDFELQPLWNRQRPKSECFNTLLKYCSIDAYRHGFKAEVTFCYHVKARQARCIPWQSNQYYSWWLNYYKGTRYGST
ncbi:LamG-like jellyroll fold domain-containing protein [Nonomuraea sp. NPDC050227]|uniref:LamG-like jellyroll fold domain-containing protein n=1 Tax=Nonomuraea sp. NPDC050227 TaxID=3364360 RepID=UPI00379EAB7A